MFRLFSKVITLLIVLVFSSTIWASEAIWIDVRSAEEYNTEHVVAAANIPYTEISGRIGVLTGDKDALIYVYCRSGRRSGIARSTLEEAGYSNVVNLGGLADAQHKALEIDGQ
jgi:phage shock protein E